MKGRESLCPCDTGLSYAACCGRWHAGPQHLQAPDAPHLMRSRYSAFVLGLSDYLLETWHPSTRPTSLEPDPPELKWLGLQVRSSRQDTPDEAFVEFVARTRLHGKAQRLHELSRFVKEKGRWFYVDGEFR